MGCSEVTEYTVHCPLNPKMCINSESWTVTYGLSTPPVWFSQTFKLTCRHHLRKVELCMLLSAGICWQYTLNFMYEYTINGLRLQANVASAVLTQVVLECTCSVPKVYIQCRLTVGCISFAVLTGV